MPLWGSVLGLAVNLLSIETPEDSRYLDTVDLETPSLAATAHTFWSLM
jgi:hypothetical protein